ncbi:asparaginase [Corynebacterium lizhenjunii]|uniref:asparaginase n=1 Tax=Corynebacterium lizhenjunii TaxID=2709394 RepID=A0A7T0PB90_9CORY|nr:asparaginase [Corynebacterium lizhenjunii]QPK78492.1 asparaginase [Corynebacterium lizhenjunii]
MTTSAPAPTVLISTGGTIACTQDASGALVPTLTAADLAAYLPQADIRAIDYRRLDSSAITFADIDGLIALVAQEAAAGPARIIITHGTDSLEETALALALFHTGEVPVILTGAQRSADAAAPDGPGNLADCLDITTPGVWIRFGGRTVPAWGARKLHTSALDAFAAADTPAPTAVVPLPVAALASTKVAVISAYPGATRELVDAACAAGYQGLVIEALGSGNMGPDMGAGVAAALEQGVRVIITTRVPEGEVSLVYGGQGGGATLADAGALGSGTLRAGQCRVLLAAALATGTDPAALLG